MIIFLHAIIQLGLKCKKTHASQLNPDCHLSYANLNTITSRTTFDYMEKKKGSIFLDPQKILDSAKTTHSNCKGPA